MKIKYEKKMESMVFKKRSGSNNGAFMNNPGVRLNKKLLRKTLIKAKVKIELEESEPTPKSNDGLESENNDTNKDSSFLSINYGIDNKKSNFFNDMLSQNSKQPSQKSIIIEDANQAAYDGNFIHKAIKGYCIHSSFDRKGDNEFEHLVRKISSLQNRVEQCSPEGIVITFSNFFVNLVKYLTDSNHLVGYELVMVGFKILRRYMESDTNEDNTTDDIDADEDQNSKEAKDDINESYIIEHKQNTLIGFNVCNLIFKTIKGEYDKEIKEQALVLGNLILEGGNQKAQNTFLKYIEEDSENEFLRIIKEMLDDSFEIIKKEMLIKNDNKLNNDICEGDNMKVKMFDEKEGEVVVNGNNRGGKGVQEQDSDEPEEYLSHIKFSNHILQFFQ